MHTTDLPEISFSDRPEMDKLKTFMISGIVD